MTSPEEPDEDELRTNRIGAEYEAKFAAHLRDRGMDQSISMGAWLVASLLALNGGGALAVLNAVERLADPTVPATIFVTGIMFALANGAGVQASGYAMLKPVNELMGYWLSVADDGIRSEQFEKELNAKMRPILLKGKIVTALGWISAGLFLIGCVTFGTNFRTVPNLEKAASTKGTVAADRSSHKTQH